MYNTNKHEVGTSNWYLGWSQHWIHKLKAVGVQLFFFLTIGYKDNSIRLGCPQVFGHSMLMSFWALALTFLIRAQPASFSLPRDSDLGAWHGLAMCSTLSLWQVQWVHVLAQFLVLLKSFDFIIGSNQPTPEVQLLLGAVNDFVLPALAQLVG